MFTHYVKSAFRSLKKRKLHSLVNILGLSLGICFSLLISLYVLDEFKYDKFHQNPEDIYRLKYHIDFQGRAFSSTRGPITMAPLMKEMFPEIQSIARVYPRSVSIESLEDEAGQPLNAFEEDQVFFADSGIASIFSFDFVHGSEKNSLREPFSTIISQKAAKKYFGDKNPQGELLRLSGEHIFKITGVFKDFPSPSHIHPDFFFPFENMYDIEPPAIRDLMLEHLPQNWMITHSLTYVRLHPGSHVELVNHRFAELLDEHGDERIRDGQDFSLQPITDIRLNDPDLSGQLEPVSSMTRVYMFLGIAFIILLIACINFINLSTAAYLKRSTEVGVRKVLGANKRMLIRQFFTESWIVTLIAFAFAIDWTILALPSMNDLTQKTFEAADLLRPEIVLGALALLLLTGFLSGSYPSFFVANFPIVQVLKSRIASHSNRSIDIRKVLVVTQFTASVILIIGTLALHQQVQLLTQRPLGFNQDQIITLQLNSQNLNAVFGGGDAEMRQRTNAFEDKLLTHPNIVATTLSSQTPGTGAINRNVIPEGRTFETRVVIPVLSVDYDFSETYDLKVLAGRDFDVSFGTDHLQAFMVNEMAVKEFGWGTPDSAIGKTIDREGKKGQIIGVINDFNYLPLNNPVGAILLEVFTPNFGVFSVKVNMDNIAETLAFMEETWQESFPEKVFQYEFLDAQLDEQYQAEQRLTRILTYFAGLAIFISCLGLFSLSLFMAIDRAKEVAIRKVLGASVPQLLALLSGGFLKLIAIATLIAWPVSYWLLDTWLEDYAHKISVGLGLFVVPTLIVFIIAVLTIGFQTFRTAHTAPVEALREE